LAVSLELKQLQSQEKKSQMQSLMEVKQRIKQQSELFESSEDSIVSVLGSCDLLEVDVLFSPSGLMIDAVLFVSSCTDIMDSPNNFRGIISHRFALKNSNYKYKNDNLIFR